MRSQDNILRLARNYWPLLAIPPIAALIHIILVAIGDPWSPGEWASNIVFAYVVTLATVMLSRRQGQLQESSASAGLIERIATVTGALDQLQADCHASTAQQILVDARAGLQLVPHAGPETRREYLQTLCAAGTRLQAMVTGSVRPYTLWTPADWSSIRRAAQNLRAALSTQIRRREDTQSESFITLQEILVQLEQDRGGLGEVPFGPFEKSFRHGDVNQRVRVLLNWDLLRAYVASDRAKIVVHREWSLRWLERHDVFSVWYSNADKTFAQYHDSDVHPINLDDVDEYFEALPVDSQATIESMTRSLEVRRDGSLPTTEIVTMQLSPGRLLVLDGNHRIAAIRRRRDGRDTPLLVTVVEYRLTAPQDLELLPDLTYHQDEVTNGDSSGEHGVPASTRPSPPDSTEGRWPTLG